MHFGWYVVFVAYVHHCTACGSTQIQVHSVCIVIVEQLGVFGLLSRCELNMCIRMVFRCCCAIVNTVLQYLTVMAHTLHTAAGWGPAMPPWVDSGHWTWLDDSCITWPDKNNMRVASDSRHHYQMHHVHCTGCPDISQCSTSHRNKPE